MYDLLYHINCYENSSIGRSSDSKAKAQHWTGFESLVQQGVVLPESPFSTDFLTVSVQPSCAITCIKICACMVYPPNTGSHTIVGHTKVLHTLILFPQARQEFGMSIAPCRLGSLAAVQQRWVHGHFTRWTLIFRFKSMVEEKWTSGQEHKGRTCPL